MHLSALAGHRLWAPAYDSTPNPLVALEQRIVANAIPVVAGQVCLDIACGSGRRLVELERRGANVIGVDLCVEMLWQAQEKPSIRNRVVLGDACALPFRTAASDITFCSFAASYFGNLRLSLLEMARVTRHGGAVVMSDMHPDAIVAGWKRSFRANGTLYEMDYNRQLHLELASTAERAGLQLLNTLESRFDEPERLVFRAAGKEELFPEACRVAALWVGIWKKG